MGGWVGFSILSAFVCERISKLDLNIDVKVYPFGQ